MLGMMDCSHQVYAGRLPPYCRLSSLTGSAGETLLWDMAVEPLQCARRSPALTGVPLAQTLFSSLELSELDQKGGWHEIV